MQTIENVPNNTLKSLRTVMFRELMDLRNDLVEPQHAIAVSKISSQVIDSYKTEILAVATANGLKDKNIAYAASLTTIQTEDTKSVL